VLIATRLQEVPAALILIALPAAVLLLVPIHPEEAVPMENLPAHQVDGEAVQAVPVDEEDTGEDKHFSIYFNLNI